MSNDNKDEPREWNIRQWLEKELGEFGAGLLLRLILIIVTINAILIFYHLWFSK